MAIKKETVHWIIAFVILIVIVVIADIVLGRIHK